MMHNSDIVIGVVIIGIVCFRIKAGVIMANVAGSFNRVFAAYSKTGLAQIFISQGIGFIGIIFIEVVIHGIGDGSAFRVTHGYAIQVIITVVIIGIKPMADGISGYSSDGG